MEAAPEEEEEPPPDLPPQSHQQMCPNEPPLFRSRVDDTLWEPCAHCLREVKDVHLWRFKCKEGCSVVCGAFWVDFVLCSECGLDRYGPHPTKVGRRALQSQESMKEAKKKFSGNPEAGLMNRMVRHLVIDLVNDQKKKFEETQNVTEASGLHSDFSREVWSPSRKRKRIAELEESAKQLKRMNRQFREEGSLRDARYEKDVKHHPASLSKLKYLSRMRSQELRLSGRPARAEAQFELQASWDAEFRGPKAARATAKDKVATVGKFDGDRADLPEVYVRRPLSRREKELFKTSPQPERKMKPKWFKNMTIGKSLKRISIDPRSWVKPQHRKRNTEAARQKHYAKMKLKFTSSRMKSC